MENSRKTISLLCLLALFVTPLIAQWEPASWPDEEPKFESAFFSRIGVTVANVDESLKFYRDILGMELLLDRKKMYDPRLPEFSGITPDQTFRFVILKTNMSTELMFNAGYLALSEVCDAEGNRLEPKKKVQATGSEPGSIMIQFVVDNNVPIYERVKDLPGYEVIFAPEEKPDGKHTELLVRDPNGLRLWITDRYSRTIFLENKGE